MDERPLEAPVRLPSPTAGDLLPNPPGNGASHGDDEPLRWDDQRLLKERRRPQRGLPAAVYTVSGGRINLGPSEAELRHEALMERVRRPIPEPPHTVAVSSAKGGVGKTTTALALASRLGLDRDDRILTVEANPHHGTIRSRVRVFHERGIKDLLHRLCELERDEDLSYPMLDRFLSRNDVARLHVLAAPMDPADSEPLVDRDYSRALWTLHRHFNLVVLDLGTDLRGSSTQWILGHACDQAVVVVESAVDGAQLGDYTLDRLVALRGQRWVKERAVVVINQVRKDTLINVEMLERHFRRRVRHVLQVRWDRHLEAGGYFDWSQINAGTQEDYLGLAASVADGFVLSGGD